MKKSLLALACLMLLVSVLPMYGRVPMPPATKPGKKKDGRKFQARITFYHRLQDKFRDNTASGVKAAEGITIAAHSDFPIGTKVYIPKLKELLGHTGYFEVQDRGTDVERKKASNGKAYVFDIYIYAKNRLDGHRRLQQLMRSADDYMEVVVL